MAESLIAVGAKNAHTWNRTISATSLEDEFQIPGEYPYATYRVIGSSVATTTANSHMLQIMAGASLNVRIRKIRVHQVNAPAAANIIVVQLWRLSTAGTGGTAVTARPHDSADVAAGATAMTLPTVKGSESVQLDEQSLWLGTASLLPGTSSIWEWVQQPNEKPIIIPAGAANGIAFKNAAGGGTASLGFSVTIVETNFV